MTGRLLHYSATPIDVLQDSMNLDFNIKPNGLWVGVEGEYDWATWCRDNDTPLLNIAHCYAVTLAPAANLLWIRTPAELQAFDLIWRGGRIPLHSIRWRDLAEVYDGLIITPYLWSQRLGGPDWYYTWDCASGCIWRAAAIERLDRLAEAPLPQRNEAAT